MGQKIFCNKIKKSALIILSALLVIPTLIGVLGLSRDTYAALETCDGKGENCRIIKVYANGSTTNVSPSQIAMTISGTQVSYEVSGISSDGECYIKITSGGETRTVDSWNFDQINKVEFYSSDGSTLLTSQAVSTGSGTIAVAASGTGTGAGSGTGTGSGEQNTEATTCHTTAGAVGWVVCPILELAASASQWAYKDVVEPSLRLRSELFSTTDGNGKSDGTYRAWGTFRDIANVVFVILLLFVIISQVTGFGIDNYGIKKTLPKLIIAAILVNLSFYICQGLVDLSNIAGSGAYNLINGIGDSITVPDLGLGQDISYATSIIATVAAAIGAGAITATVAGAGIWSLISGALLAVLPVFISAFISVLFLFFLLAMRQAIVVLLVAISPLAFVCYTLPNTKKLFDRWTQLLKGMLLLYPIAAMLVAGGRLASKIILASGAATNNLFVILVAMVAEAGPLFLIPSLTRSAYQATGALSGALNGLRGRLAGGGRNLARNSGAYQRAVARNQRQRATTGLALRRVNRYNEAVAATAAGTASRRQKRLANSEAAKERASIINQGILKAEEEKRKIEMYSDKNQIEGMRQAAEISAEQATIKNANFSNPTFAGAVREQNKIENEAARDRQMLYSKNEYLDSKRNANQAILSNEISRMYSDQFGRLSIPDLQQQLKYASLGKTTDGTKDSTEHQKERFMAAASAMIQAGQADKVREVISAGKPEYADAAKEFGNLVRTNQEFRNAASGVLGSSGEFTFQEYAKHLGQKGASAMSFDEWADHDNGLKASIAAKGLDKVDKDGFEFLANHKNALSGASAENISRVAANTHDTATMAKLTQAIEQLDADTRKKVIAATDADKAASMSQEIRDALAGASGRKPDGSYQINPDNSLWQAQIGEALRDNAQIAARFSQENRAKYVAPPPTPTPPPTPPRPPRGDSSHDFGADGY